MSLTNRIIIVDENDKPIGDATIQEAREKSLIHRVARIMVENPETKQILLQKRSPKLLWPNCWDNSAAGHVDAGEDWLQGARRELREEIGIDTNYLEEVGTYFTEAMQQGYKLRRFNRVYKYETTTLPTNLQEEEVTEVRWFTPEEIRDLLKEHPEQCTDGLTDVINKYY